MTSNNEFEAKQMYLYDIDLGNATERLLVNIDFKKVILDYYLKDLVIKLSKELANYSVNTPEHNEIVRQLDAISLFDNCLFNLKLKGQLAQEDLIYLDTNPDE